MSGTTTSLRGRATAQEAGGVRSARLRAPRRRRTFAGACGWVAAILLFAVAARAADLATGFEAANKLYEQGRFADAATAYEKLLADAPSGTLHFNAGNAWFKAGQVGRAIAAYREAARFDPRDPSVRFNLKFARRKVSGGEAPPGSLWQRTLTALTLNEWAVLTAGAVWVWFVLLALREWRPSLRSSLSGYTATAGVGLVLVAGCLGSAARLHRHTRSAVVIVADAIARTGPLDEAKVKNQFRDGAEVIVLDEKALAIPGGKQTWLQVQDGTGKDGWMKRDQLLVLSSGR